MPVLSTTPGFTYTYDADGNMITSTSTSTHDVWTYTYNFLNLMTGAVEKTSTGTILAQVTYTYDALDNRIGMDENGTQTWTLYDGSDPVMDFNSSGSLEMRYLNGPTGDLVDTVIARESAGGTIAWYLPDRLGTIRDLLNNSGSIIDHVDYSAFGTQLDESSPSNGDRMMGFAGMERDTVTGLNLAVNRVQNPGTGRWTSQDPLGFAAGDPDLYRYAGNDPENATDPNGLREVIFVEPPRKGPKSNWEYAPFPVPPPKYSRSTGRVLKKIFPIAEGTWIWDFAPEGCERWVFAFEENLKRSRFSNPNIKDHGVAWEPSRAIGGGHAIYKFILNDGTIIVVDHWIYYGGTRYRVIIP
jgi:RHS repeat-associated protein